MHIIRHKDLDAEQRAATEAATRQWNAGCVGDCRQGRDPCEVPALCRAEGARHTDLAPGAAVVLGCVAGLLLWAAIALLTTFF